MTRIGSRAEYVEAARAECESMTREEILIRVSALMRECDRHVNRIEAWQVYAIRLGRIAVYDSQIAGIVDDGGTRDEVISGGVDRP